MMQVRRMVPQDLIDICELNPTESGTIWNDAVFAHPAYTGLQDGQPVVSAGIVETWPGLGQAWAAVSEKATRSPGLFKAVKLGLWKIAMKHKFHRVETVINVESPLSLRFRNFAEHLGFELESHMPFYGPNKETYLKMVWFPPEQFYVR